MQRWPTATSRSAARGSPSGGPATASGSSTGSPSMLSLEPRAAEQNGSAPRAATPGTLVLGMHRSGTSAATRVINLLGAHLCRADDLLPDLRGNPRGHWESSTLVDVNDRLLDDMGRS